jgi:hypothetical protein
MKNNHLALVNLIEAHGIDLELFYAVSVYKNNCVLQGFFSSESSLIGYKFASPITDKNGFLNFNFEYESTKFVIVLTNL